MEAIKKVRKIEGEMVDKTNKKETIGVRGENIINKN